MSLTPKMLSFAVMLALAGTAAAANTNSPAVGRALGLIQTHGGAVLASANDRYIARDVILDVNGTEHVRMSRSYRGLPMIGADIVVHSRGGQFQSTSLTLGSTGRPSLEGKLRGDDAITIAGADFGTGFDGLPTSRKVIYALGANKPVLAHEVSFAGTKRNGDPTARPWPPTPTSASPRPGTSTRTPSAATASSTTARA